MIRLLLTLLMPGQIGAVAHAQDREPALAWNADDAQLKWGPCPPFLPEGCGIAVLHGDPAKDNLDVFLRVPGEVDPAAALAHSAERMVLVAGELHVTYDGQKTTVLKPGTYAYGPAKLPHEATCASASPMRPLYCL